MATLYELPIAANARIAARLTAPADEIDGDDAMACMMGEVARALEADGLLVTWHDHDGAPMFLFRDGACEASSPAERCMAESAALAASAGNDRPFSAWRTFETPAANGVLTTAIPAGDGIVTISSLFKRIGGSTRQSARDGALRLMPLLQPFLKLWTMRMRMIAHVQGLTAAVNHCDISILLVNRDAQPIFANAAAESLIAQNDGLRRTRNTICATVLADTLRLQAAIEHVLAVEALPLVGRAQPAPVVALHRKNGRPLMAAVISCEQLQQGGQDSAAVIYIFDPEQDLRPLVEPACKLYGLSPVETRLTCLLTDGMNLADAAEKMHVREQTARSYLKQIFQKTSTNRQAELVWLMLKSAVRTAPNCRASFV